MFNKKKVKDLKASIKTMELDFITRLKESENKSLTLKDEITSLQNIISDMDLEVEGITKQKEHEVKEREKVTQKLIDITVERDITKKSLEDATKTMNRLREDLEVKESIIKFELRK
jgi:hypothetical protein